MLRTSLIFCFAAAALAQPSQMDTPINFAPGVPGTGRQISSGSSVINPGVTVRFKTMLKWIGAPPDNLGRGFGRSGSGSGHNAFQRVVVDNNTGSYFGYELAFGEGDATTGYLVTFQQPSDGFSHLLRQPPGVAPLNPMPPPKYPAPQLVHDGDTLEIDLMASPDGTQKLTDYIEISLHDPETPGAAATAEPRDFTVDDGPLKFQGGPFMVSRQGQRIQATSLFYGRPGATFWVAIPGQGRYILSLTPQNGFTKAGAIRGNVISFQDAEQEYEVRLLGPVAGAGKAWNLYMLHDLTYDPGPNQPNAIRAGTDRLENLLPKPQ